MFPLNAFTKKIIRSVYTRAEVLVFRLEEYDVPECHLAALPTQRATPPPFYDLLHPLALQPFPYILDGVLLHGLFFYPQDKCNSVL
jgi:hypothetical protein